MRRSYRDRHEPAQKSNPGRKTGGSAERKPQCAQLNRELFFCFQQRGEGGWRLGLLLNGRNFLKLCQGRLSLGVDFLPAFSQRVWGLLKRRGQGKAATCSPQLTTRTARCSDLCSGAVSGGMRLITGSAPRSNTGSAIGTSRCGREQIVTNSWGS